jgi:hypothetical protein
VFSIIRIEEYGDEELTAEHARQTLINTRQYLERYGLYSLTEFNRVIAAANSMDNQLSLLSAFSAINAEIVDQIITRFRLASEIDMLHTAQTLEDFHKNLLWDQSFTLKLMSQPFHHLDNISFSLKKQLLDEITSLTEKYKAIPEHKRTIETY